MSYSLMALIAFTAFLSGSFLVLWVLPQTWASIRLYDAEARVEKLEIAFEGFAAQYGLTNTQTKAVIGKLQRKLAEAQREDDDEESSNEETPFPLPAGAETPPLPVAAIPPAGTFSKADLIKMRARARTRNGA